MNINEFEAVELSDIEKISSDYISTLESEKPFLNNIFNVIQPTLNIPFISWNNISKIHRDFEYKEEYNWINKDINSIFFKYKRWNYVSEQEENYGNAKIILNQAGVIVFIQLIIGNESYDYNTISKNITECLGGIKLVNPVERGISSEFKIPNQFFQKHILLELLTNDPLFYRYFSVPELLKTKKPFLTIWFYPKKEDKINKSEIPVRPFSFTITQQYKENGEPFIRIKPKKKQDLTAINELRFILSRILTKYNQEEEEISKIYQELGVKNEKMKVSNKSDKSGVLKGQTRKCQDPPTVFSNLEDAKKEICKEGSLCDDERIIKFPKDGDNIKGYETQSYYACIDKKTKIWAGLTRPDANKPGDTGVPCCFVTNQKNKETSSYNKYMKGILAPLRSRTLHILGPDKILINKQQGKINSDLERMFFDYINPQEILLRNGLDPTPKSFMYCVSKAMDSNINESMLIDKSYLAKQEMYDYSISEIQDIIRTESGHLDAKMFVSLFEEVFKVNIFIINKNGLVKPRYKNAYYKNENDYPSVVIYEQDEEQTELGYNRYELVSLVEGKKIKALKFEKDSAITKFLKSEFYNKTKSKLNGVILPQYQEKISTTNLKILAQDFDESGKTRVLKIMYEGQEIYIQTTPLKPLDLPVIDSEYQITKLLIKELPQDKFVLNMSSNSELCNFIKTKRISRYFVDYILWVFSKYKYERSKNGITKFINEKIKLDPDYTYTNITQKFNENTGIMNNKKIIISSISIIKRIEFILNMTIIRNEKILDSYSNMEYLPEFFKELNDFKRNLSKKECDPKDWESYEYNIFLGNNFLKL